MKVLLIQPDNKSTVGLNNVALIEPTGLEAIGGSLLNDKHNVRIVDLRAVGKDPDKYLDNAIKEFKPDAYGFSCSFTPDVYRVLELAKKVKNDYGAKFVFVGGHHVSVYHIDFNIKEIDAVVIGEGEITVVELLRAYEATTALSKIDGLAYYDNVSGEQVKTKPRSLIKNISEAPFFARHLTAEYRKKYYLGIRTSLACIETARGCPFKCDFCSVWNFYRGTYRSKSPERVVSELKSIKEDYVLVTDDNFFSDVKRAKIIGELIKKAKIKKLYTIQARSDTIVKHPELIKQWKEVGLSNIFIGFESVDDETLNDIHKDNSSEMNEKAYYIAKKHDVAVTASFIVSPSFSKIDFEKLMNFVKRLKISVPVFSVLTPLPGTKLFNELKNKLTITDYSYYDLFHPVLDTLLPTAEFFKEFSNLYKTSYKKLNLRANDVLFVIKYIMMGKMSLDHMIKLKKSMKSISTPSTYTLPLVVVKS
ncbi:MAG: B12-binding domain-containing radical SAM protein [bacterium]